MNNTENTSKKTFSTKEITKTALMAALICLATFFFKVPTLHGYTHIGDGFIFIAVYLLGTKKGALAGGIGAALSDLIGGYAMWVAPTFVIKALMALAMGAVAYKVIPELKGRMLIGSIVGGLVQVVLYTLVKIPLYNLEYALAGIVEMFVQSGAGIVIMVIAIAALEKTHLAQKLKEA